MIKQSKILCYGHMLLMMSTKKKLLELYFFEKELQKTSQKEFRFEKVIKRKGSKLYDKWKKVTIICWIDKKYLV